MVGQSWVALGTEPNEANSRHMGRGCLRGQLGRASNRPVSGRRDSGFVLCVLSGQGCLHLLQLKRASKESIIPALFFMAFHKSPFTAAIKAICVNVTFMAERYSSIWLHRHWLNDFSVVGYLGCFVLFIIMRRVVIFLLGIKEKVFLEGNLVTA